MLFLQILLATFFYNKLLQSISNKFSWQNCVATFCCKFFVAIWCCKFVLQICVAKLCYTWNKLMRKVWSAFNAAAVPSAMTKGLLTDDRSILRSLHEAWHDVGRDTTCPGLFSLQEASIARIGTSISRPFYSISGSTQPTQQINIIIINTDKKIQHLSRTFLK